MSDWGFDQLLCCRHDWSMFHATIPLGMVTRQRGIQVACRCGGCSGWWLAGLSVGGGLGKMWLRTGDRVAAHACKEVICSKRNISQAQQSSGLHCTIRVKRLMAAPDKHKNKPSIFKAG